MSKRVIAALAAVLLAIVGVVLLINYTNEANDRAFDGAKLVSVLQVQEPIPVNTKAEDIGDKVEVVELPKKAIAKGAIADLSEVKGLSTLTELEPGEQLIDARFGAAGSSADTPTKSKSSIPKGMQEVTVPLSVARAAGGVLKPGDLVGVVVSYQTREGDGQTQLIRNYVQVTRVAGTQAVADGAPQTDQLVTLAVKTRDAGKIINGLEFGKVWITRQNADTETGSGGSISRDDVTE